MKRNRTRLPTVIIIILLVALFSVGAIDSQVVTSSAAQPPQTAAGEQNGGGEVSAKTSTTEWLASTRPWSKERMLAAQPYPLINTEGNLTSIIELTEPVGKPALKPSSPPEGYEIESRTEEFIEISSNASLLGYSYPPPYTRFKNFDSYQIFPYSTIGVLFFSQYDVDFRCSAASIGKDAVWTAGHCVHAGDDNPDGWSEDVIFVPAYKNGDAPFGVWTAYNIWTKGSWYSVEDLRFDMGGAVLNTNSSGKMISQVVGNLGFSYNLSSSDQLWFNFGYPTYTPFDGKWQFICTGPFAYNDSNLNEPYPVGMGCDMTRGSSGGPWIKDFSGVAGSANFLNGNNSYRYTNHPEEMFSPYFGEAAKTLWNQLMGITERILLPIVMR